MGKEAQIALSRTLWWRRNAVPAPLYPPRPSWPTSALVCHTLLDTCVYKSAGGWGAEADWASTRFHAESQAPSFGDSIQEVGVQGPAFRTNGPDNPEAGAPGTTLGNIRPEKPVSSCSVLGSQWSLWVSSRALNSTSYKKSFPGLYLQSPLSSVILDPSLVQNIST